MTKGIEKRTGKVGRSDGGVETDESPSSAKEAEELSDGFVLGRSHVRLVAVNQGVAVGGKACVSSATCGESRGDALPWN